MSNRFTDNFYFTSVDKIIPRLLLASFLKSVGFRISLRQLWSHSFGPFWRHTEYLSSSPPLRNTEDLTYGTGQSSSRAGQSSSKQPIPDYTCSSTSSRALPSFRTDSSSTSPSSDSDCGLEMKAKETQPRRPAKDSTLEMKCRGPTTNNSSLRHRIKQTGTVLEKQSEFPEPVIAKTLQQNC